MIFLTDNYSDDELLFLPFLTFWHAQSVLNTTLSKTLAPYMQMSITRAWSIVHNYNPTPWAAIATLYGVPDVDPKKAVCPLFTFHWDHVDFPTDNSKRIDLVVGRNQDWLNKNQYLPPVLPYDELSFYRWNTNPFELNATVGGMTEVDPGAFLFAYYLALTTFE